MPKPFNLFIISGPSGVGEDSIIDGLGKLMPIERVITTTTRAMRSGESEGNPYYFISKETFQKGIDEEEFVEYAEEYNKNLYGVTKKELDRVIASGKVGIWKIEWRGVITAKKLFPHIKAIFIGAESLAVLENRIRRRENVSDAYIEERMRYTKEWMKHTDIYDYTVINREGKLHVAIKEVQTIIEKELGANHA